MITFKNKHHGDFVWVGIKTFLIMLIVFLVCSFGFSQGIGNPKTKLRDIQNAPGQDYFPSSDANGKWYPRELNEIQSIVDLDTINYTPQSTGNIANNNQFVIDPVGDVYFISALPDGDAIKLSGTDTQLTEAHVDSFVSNNGYLKFVRDSLTTHPYLRKFRGTYSSENFEGFVNGDSRTQFGHVPNTLRSLFINDGFKYGGIGYVGFALDAVSNLNITATGSIIDKTGDGWESSIGKIRVLTTGQSYAISTESIFGEFENITLYYLQKTAGGSFDLLIDGVLNQTVNTSGAKSIQKIEITGLADDNHTMTINHNSGGDVSLSGYVLHKNEGFRIHNIGNSGASSSHFADSILNIHLYSDFNPDLFLIRLGVNGGDLANTTTATEGAANHKIITDRIKAINSNCSFIWTGEGDNATYTVEQINDYNLILSNKADDEKSAFFNMFEIIPDWSDFNVEGLGDATVHENNLGGAIIGQWYYDNFKSAKYEGSSSSGVSSGTVNRLSYYSDTDLLSSSNIYTDGSKMVINGTNTNQSIGLSIQGTNEQIASFGSGTTNPLFTLNDKSGYLSMNWIAKFENPDWLSVSSALRPLQLTRDANSFRFNTADITTAGNAITCKGLFIMNGSTRSFVFNDPNTSGQFQIRHGTRTQNWQQYLDLTNTEMKFDNNDSGRNIDFAFGGVTEVSMRNNKTVFNSPIQLLGTITTPQIGYVWKATDTSGNGDWQAETGGGASLWETSSTGLIPSNSVNQIAVGAAIQTNRSIVTGGNVDFAGTVIGVSGGASILNANTGNFTITNYSAGSNLVLRNTKTDNSQNTVLTANADSEYLIFSGNTAINGPGRSGGPGATIYIRSDGISAGSKVITALDSGDVKIFEVSANGDCEITGTLIIGSIIISTGTGTPEGFLTANPGSTFHRTDGAANTSYYVKESGTGNTGWVAK